METKTLSEITFIIKFNELNNYNKTHYIKTYIMGFIFLMEFKDIYNVRYKDYVFKDYTFLYRRNSHYKFPDDYYRIIKYIDDSNNLIENIHFFSSTDLYKHYLSGLLTIINEELFSEEEIKKLKYLSKNKYENIFKLLISKENIMAFCYNAKYNLKYYIRHKDSISLKYTLRFFRAYYYYDTNEISIADMYSKEEIIDDLTKKFIGENENLDKEIITKNLFNLLRDLDNFKYGYSTDVFSKLLPEIFIQKYYSILNYNILSRYSYLRYFSFGFVYTFRNYIISQNLIRYLRINDNTIRFNKEETKEITQCIIDNPNSSYNEVAEAKRIRIKYQTL